MTKANSNGATPASNTRVNITKEVAAMQRMSTAQLRDKYAEVFGESPRRMHKRYMIKRIAWRMQANAQGGLTERARNRAQKLANDADLRLTAPPPPDPEAGLRPGCALTRNYKGRRIVVMVRDNGFEYEGQIYKSLSAVAKAITGSHWSGKHFFGLQKGGSK